MTEPPYTIPSTEIQYVWFIPALDNGRLELSDKVLAVLETAARGRAEYLAKDKEPVIGDWPQRGKQLQFTYGTGSRSRLTLPCLSIREGWLGVPRSNALSLPM